MSGIPKHLTSTSKYAFSDLSVTRSIVNPGGEGNSVSSSRSTAIPGISAECWSPAPSSSSPSPAGTVAGPVHHIIGSPPSLNSAMISSIFAFESAPPSCALNTPLNNGNGMPLRNVSASRPSRQLACGMYEAIVANPSKRFSSIALTSAAPDRSSRIFAILIFLSPTGARRDANSKPSNAPVKPVPASPRPRVRMLKYCRRYGWTFALVYDQAPEGRLRRQAGAALYQTLQKDNH